MRNSVVDVITRMAEEDESVFVVTGDAGFGVLDSFARLFPRRFVNLGVAEQNMISFSAGLSLSGYRVYVYNIIPFVLYRCYEQVRNDICYQGLPVTLVGIGSGVTYAPQGMTHYSVEDVTLARTLPNLTILSPADPVEAIRCAEHTRSSKGPVYIRLAKTGEPAIHGSADVDITKPLLIREGEKAAVLFHGSIGVEVMEAIQGCPSCPCKVLSVPMLQPLDLPELGRMLGDVDSVITVEEHYVSGGLGSIVAEWVTAEGLPFRLERMGIRNEYIHVIRNTKGMREHYGFSAEHIARRIKAAFR